MEHPLSRTPGDLLREQAARRGGHPAVVHSDGSTSYADLHGRAVAVSRALRRDGVGFGDRVGLLATNRVEWLECYFGASMAGATVHAFNSWVTGRELDHLLGEADCTALVMLERHGRRTYLEDLRGLAPEVWHADPGEWDASRYPGLESLVVVGGTAPRGGLDYEQWLDVDDADDVPARLVSAVDHGVVLYTSGSTARPKAVPLLGHGMVENGFHIGERMALTQDDRVWLSSPLFWSYGCANALMATFTHGATLVLQEQFDPAAAVDLIEANECTAAYLLPTLTRAILDQEGLDVGRLSSLRTGLTIGTPDDVRLAAEAMGIGGICNVYGSTETYGNCCVTPWDAELTDRLTSQGPPLPGVSVRTVDPITRVATDVDEVGAIEVKGYLTPGYLGEDAPVDVFTADGYYRTGDLGSLDERGWLHFSARATEMIKTSGINVAPAEVEEFMAGLDGVAQVAVVGAPDEARGEVVVAYVVPDPDRTLEESHLIAECRSGMSSYKVPTRVVVLAELPKTSTGKLHRAKLKDLSATPAPAAVAATKDIP
ncbi:MAG: class I adenylate-forming enzyme family protein [Nocardioidaceae bacterium]